MTKSALVITLIFSLLCIHADSNTIPAPTNGVINLPSGIIRLEKPITLTAANSGVIFRGASDGSTIISGAIELKGLVFKKDDKGIYSSTCNLDNPDQLLVNGVRYAMARFPNRLPNKNVYDTWTLSEHNEYDRTKDALTPERIKSWKHPEAGYLHAMHNLLWGDMHWKIEGKDDNGNLKLIGGWQNNRSSPRHNVFKFVENIREELDQPGEWFYDNIQKKLLIIPLPNDDLTTARIETVRLRTLIEARGTKSEPVRNIRFENIGFTAVARTFMDNREPLLRSDWTICREAAIVFSNTKGITLHNCSFRHVGGNAVIFNGYNIGGLLENCSFEEIGANGVAFVGKPDAVRNPFFNYSDVPDYTKLDLTPGPKSENYPRECKVYKCKFIRTGRDEKQTAAVQICIASRISVIDTFIRKTPRAAINIGDGCFGGHLIEGCDVAETVLETGDHGAFNSWGRDRFWQSNIGNFEKEVEKNNTLPFLDAIEPTIIRGNRWHCAHGWDVDLDDGSSNYIIENNDFLLGGLKLREGYRRIVRNNRALNNTLHRHCWPLNNGDVIVSNTFARPFADILMRPTAAIVRENTFLTKNSNNEANRPTAWSDGLVREFNGPAEFSAFGVGKTQKGVVVIRPPKGSGLLWNDLITDAAINELPALPLSESIIIIRNQKPIKYGELKKNLSP